MKTLFLTLLFSTSLVASEKKTIALLGQYHLSAKAITKDIEQSKQLPQFNNQKAIYLVLDEWVRNKKLQLIISEGCEGEIDEKFRPSFNGWNYLSLRKNRKLSVYEDILTLVPLKIEAKYDKEIKTLCGDDLQMIAKHQLLFSDLKGYIGFFTRLKESVAGTKKYESYLRALEDSEKRKIKQPVDYLKKKIKGLIEQEEAMVSQRNKSFLKVVQGSEASTVAIVIGNRHLEDLKTSLEKQGHKVLLFDLVQETIPKNDLHQQLKSMIE